MTKDSLLRHQVTILSLAPLYFVQMAFCQEPELEPKKKELRPLSADRPDVTESPKSVDAGHFQVEMDAARYTRDSGLSAYSFANTNLKLGLTSFMDAQVVVESLLGLEEAAGYNWGFGDITLRTKINLVGNDDGQVAIGLLPWVKIPTAGSRGNGSVEGGMAGIVGLELPAEFGAGFQVQGDMLENTLGDGHHFELLTTATLGRTIIGPLGAFVELFGVHSTEAGASYLLSFNGGFTYMVTPLFMLDAGSAVGITDAAEDVSVFAGASFKI